MSKKILSLFNTCFFSDLGFSFSGLHFANLTGTSISKDLSAANYIYLIPAVVMLMVSHFIRALRWKILMEPLGYKPGVTNTFLAVMVGYWANLAVPRFGEVLKCTILARYEKVPADKLVGTIVAERAVDVLSACRHHFSSPYFLNMILIGGFASGNISNKFLLQGLVSFSGMKVSIVVLVLISFIVFSVWMFRRLSHLAIISKTKDIFLGIWQGLISIRNIKNKWLFIFHSIVIWLLYLYSTYMGFFAMQDMAAIRH